MMDAAQIGKWVMGLGLVLVAVGGGLWLAARLGLPLGSLPGDIKVDRPGGSFRFPIVTCIVISVVLIVLLNVLARVFHR